MRSFSEGIAQTTWGNGEERQAKTPGAQEPAAHTAAEQQVSGCSLLSALERH